MIVFCETTNLDAQLLGNDATTSLYGKALTALQEHKVLP
jgi:hypothetical protein